MQNGADSRYMSYVYDKIKERFSYLPAECDFSKQGEFSQVTFRAGEQFCPYVQAFSKRLVAEVISIGYKFAYFEKTLRLPLLSTAEKRLLCTALVAADVKEELAFIQERIQDSPTCSIDGVFRFRVKELKNRWEEVAKYIQSDFGVESLNGFLRYVIEDGVGKAFIKDNKAYNGEYKILNKSGLTGKSSLVGEILLSGAAKVYTFGKTDDETEKFLQKYYGEKRIFC